MVLARGAAHGEVPDGRIAEGGEDVPGRGDEQDDGESGEGAQALPGSGREELPGQEQVDEGRAEGEDDTNQALEEQACAEACGENRGPCPGVPLLLVERAEKGPQRERDGERLERVRQEDAGEEPEADAGGDAEAGKEAGAVPECPSAEGRREEREADRRQDHGEARRPVVNAEEPVGAGDHPVEERGLFKVGDSIEARGHPVAGGEHIAGDLRLHRVDVVHQRRRREDAAEVDRRGEERHQQEAPVLFQSLAVSSCLPDFSSFEAREGADWIFHRFIHRNSMTRPHKW